MLRSTIKVVRLTEHELQKLHSRQQFALSMNQPLTLLHRLDQFSLSDAQETELAAADAS